MTARAHAGSRSVWNGAAFCGRARLTTWWRSRWRSSAVFCPASLGAIHRRRGGRRRSDDVFGFAVGDGCDSIANATASGSLPADLAAAHAMILAERAARPEAEARIANARRSRADRLLQACDREAAPAALRLRARSVRRGSSSRWSFSWKSWRPLATEDELAAEQAAVARAGPRPSATRARRHPGAGELCLLPLIEAGEAWRGHHRDAGGDPAPVEGNPDGARDVLVPELRDDHAAGGTLPRDAARLWRPRPAVRDPVRAVQAAPAVEPSERALPAGR